MFYRKSYLDLVEDYENLSDNYTRACLSYELLSAECIYYKKLYEDAEKRLAELKK